MIDKTSLPYLFALVVLGMLVTACGVTGAGVTVPPVATTVPPTATTVPPTATTVPPTATAVPPTATTVPPMATTVSPTATVNPNADAWAQVRAQLPANVPVYKPAFLPARFGAPKLLEVQNDAEGPRYTIYYTAPDEQIAFILGQGAGAWGNSPPPDSREPLTINGMTGELDISTSASPPFVVSWQDQGFSYEVKAASAKMTKEEIKQIVASLAPVK